MTSRAKKPATATPVAAKPARRGGRKAFAPTEDQRKMVNVLASFGVPEKDIAEAIGVSEPTLRKHFKDTLRIAHVQANAKVAQSLFKKATGDGPQSVAAAIFWLKVRAGWNERPGNGDGGEGQNGAPVTQQVTQITRVIVDPQHRDAPGVRPASGAGEV
jgi:hypothetical protein